MQSRRKLVLALTFLIPLTVIFSQCLTVNQAKEDPRGETYTGSAACMKCHKDVYNDYLHTAHFTGTRAADIHTMAGDFRPGHNEYIFNKDLKIVMENRKDGLYQVAYFKNKEVKAARFDITFGAVKAESYLYWQDNELFELPMSYFKGLHSWTNSPGFDTMHVNYARMIGDRCFQCHMSYIEQLPGDPHSISHPVVKYDKNSLILGIDCERCHGPGANHVKYHLNNPDDKTAHYMVTYASLPRARKLDMCGICHSGNKEMMVRNSFAFKPGDTLSAYKEQTLYQGIPDTAKLDVHGNQYQLLMSSKCYINSNMDCATCHKAHKTEQNDLAMYSQKCMNCHKTENHNFCKMSTQIGGIIKNNCIDCHMPSRSSNVIGVRLSGGGSAIPYMVRTHHIAVYNDVVQAVMKNLKNNNKPQAN